MQAYLHTVCEIQSQIKNGLRVVQYRGKIWDGRFDYRLVVVILQTWSGQVPFITWSVWIMAYIADVSMFLKYVGCCKGYGATKNRGDNDVFFRSLAKNICKKKSPCRHTCSSRTTTHPLTQSPPLLKRVLWYLSTPADNQLTLSLNPSTPLSNDSHLLSPTNLIYVFKQFTAVLRLMRYTASGILKELVPKWPPPDEEGGVNQALVRTWIANKRVCSSKL